MTYYIETNSADNVTDVWNSSGPYPIPPGAVAITGAEAQQIATHPVGHSAFDYVNGALVENTTRKAARTLARNRAIKIRQIKSEALKRIGALVPALGDTETLDLIVELVKADMLAAPAPGSDMDRVQAIYQYGKQRIAAAQTATQSQLDNYDPATDSNWP